MSTQAVKMICSNQNNNNKKTAKAQPMISPPMPLQQTTAQSMSSTEQAYSKKRKCSDDEQTPTKRARVDSMSPTDDETKGSSSSTSTASDDSSGPYGLVNVKNACYSNSVLQMLRATFSADQIDKLRGSEPLERFGISHDDLLNLNKDGRSPKTKKTSRKSLLELRSNITGEAACLREKGARIPIAPYLGEILHDMQSGIAGRSSLNEDENFVNPCFLQQVLAYRGEDVQNQRFNGDTQEDPQEYLMTLMEAIAEEHPWVRGVLGFMCTEVKTCGKCGHEKKGGQREMVQMIHRPDIESSNTLEDALKKSSGGSEALEGYRCDECHTVDTTTCDRGIDCLADNFIIYLNRVQSWVDVKVKKALALDSTDGDGNGCLKIKVDGADEFEVEAVLKHSGRLAKSGHYMAYRKHKGAWWKLNDAQEVETVPVTELADDKHCQNVMILLKKKVQKE